MDRFIDHYKDENVTTKYSAGIVHKYGNGFLIAYEQNGARDTFSIGQPVYDKDGNLMGYMGIGLYDNLDYSTEGQIRIPVEHWSICLPTEHCISDKKVFTYWQTKAEPKAGKWKEVQSYGSSTNTAICECSACGDTVGVYTGNRAWKYCQNCGAKMEGWVYTGNRAWKYCPNCGAKMEGWE